MRRAVAAALTGLVVAAGVVASSAGMAGAVTVPPLRTETVASCTRHLVRAIDADASLRPVWRRDCQELTRAQRRTAWVRADRETS